MNNYIMVVVEENKRYILLYSCGKHILRLCIVDFVCNRSVSGRWH